MLAAAVPAQAGQTALELGAGAGTASLCLAARVAGRRRHRRRDRSGSGRRWPRDNAAANGMQDCAFVAADIFALPPELKRDFDQVFANPPFHGEGQVSPDAGARPRPDGRGHAWATG